MIVFDYIIITLLGLVIGSFLNVIIYRLPIMMKREWYLQSCDIQQKAVLPEEPLNLATPPSHCPYCKKLIKPWHNIPLLSFILLKGRCAFCSAKIAYRYPLVELLSAVIAVITFWRFGLSWNMILVLILGFGLIAASCIDIAEHFIPDSITLPLLWLGLLANAFSLFVSPQRAILGTIGGYLFFWCIAKGFYWLRKKEGLGHGDFKLLALFGAWMGMWPLLNIIIVSSVLGIIVSLIFILSKKLNFQSRIPFGPFLAFAGWCTLLFGDFLTYFVF